MATNTELFSFVPTGQGIKYKISGQSALVTIKISPETSRFTTFSVTEYELPPTTRVDLHNLQLVDRAFYCVDGSGTVRIDGNDYHVEPGTLIYCGRGHFVDVASNDHPLRLMLTCCPPAADARPSLLQTREVGKLPCLQLTPEMRRATGILSAKDCASPEVPYRGPILHLGPEDGDSFWQADPSTGYITAKIAPFNSPLYHMSFAVQLLEPGARVIEHGHSQLDEILIAVQGEGRLRIDGEYYPFNKGTVGVVSRGVMHCFESIGSEPFVVYAMVTPAGVESALRETGYRRIVGAPRPDHIPRDARTKAILVDKYGFIFSPSAC